MDIKLLSKALISRLIPADAASNDMAVMMLVDDDEVDELMSTLTPVQSHGVIPSISIMMDLSRSPHNLWAFASKDAASKLSDIMDDLTEDDQAKAAQLVWTMMELNYAGTEEVSAIINNGTLQEQPHNEEGMWFD